VALKVIKTGMDTRQVVARFEAERQALAMMSHPNIARVFDAGETERGRPYFAMEFVKGEAITRYCDRHRLSTRERLELFMQVCDGVQHAHHKGIIHRDIKPSNVLVEIREDKPSPKIIDFGVAKATQQRLTEKTMFTQMGAMIGTPEYMSPEQAEITTLDVDTRTDVYSLGVLLYELLVGVLPFDLRKLREAGIDEIRRRIREEEPSKPSTRVNVVGEASTDSAKNRRTDPGSLARLLRGDLDWITMKTLEKDRTRRYGSPVELAADIERYLTDQPVLATPPSAAYRAGKFMRRHKVGVSAAVAGLVVLVVFAATMTVQADRIASERDRANLEAERANNEAETARQVSDYLVGLFEVADPTGDTGRTITARELLDEGYARIEQELADQPVVQARLMNTMGRVYGNLGLFETSAALLEQAVDTQLRSLGDQHLDTADSMTQLAFSYLRLSRMDDAQTLLEKAVAVREATLGVDHVDTGRSLYFLGLSHLNRGGFDEARVLFERALPIFESALGPDSKEASWCVQDLGVLLNAAGDNEAAHPYLERAVEMKTRSLGPEHPETAIAIGNLGFNLLQMGELDRARPHVQRAVTVNEEALGSDHPQLSAALHNLGELHRRSGEYNEAERVLRRALEIQESTLGANSPHTAETLHSLGLVAMELRDLDEAISLLERALAIREEVLNPGHPHLAETHEALAAVRREMNN
jgi:non-specific serine/threonine protein kinase/serine/threonine-protein kinase